MPMFDTLVVKMDIEGAEAQVAQGDCGWLELVVLLFIEKHDQLIRGSFDLMRWKIENVGLILKLSTSENDLLFVRDGGG